MKLETSLDLLERVRARHGSSWYGLAKLFSAHTNTVYSWKSGHTIVDRKFAPRIAELLDEPAEYVLACLEAEREQYADVRKVWERIAMKFRSRAASILLAGLVVPALLAPANQAVPTERAGPTNVDYVQLMGVLGLLSLLLRKHVFFGAFLNACRRRVSAVAV